MSLKNSSKCCNSNQEVSQQVPCYHTMQVQTKHKVSGQWMPMQHMAVQQHCLFIQKGMPKRVRPAQLCLIYPLCSQCSVSPFAPESPVQPLGLLEGWLHCIPGTRNLAIEWMWVNYIMKPITVQLEPFETYYFGRGLLVTGCMWLSQRLVAVRVCTNPFRRSFFRRAHYQH